MYIPFMSSCVTILSCFLNEKVLYFFLFYLFIFSFYGYTCSIWKFQGQGLNWSCNWDLCHSHSNTGSKLNLWPPPQLAATPDPKPIEQGQGWNLHPHRDNFRSLTHGATMGTPVVVGFFLGQKLGRPWAITTLPLPFPNSASPSVSSYFTDQGKQKVWTQQVGNILVLFLVLWKCF